MPLNLQDNRNPINHLMNSGFFIVSEKCAEVLMGFDLAESRFSPVELFYPDKETNLADDFFIFNIIGKKSSFLPGPSKGISKIFDPDQSRWLPRASVKIDQIHFAEDALIGQDIWMEEALQNCILISNRLADALKSKRLFEAWHLIRCQANMNPCRGAS